MHGAGCAVGHLHKFAAGIALEAAAGAPCLCELPQLLHDAVVDAVVLWQDHLQRKNDTDSEFFILIFLPIPQTCAPGHR
jgi:hypothetical protein